MQHEKTSRLCVAAAALVAAVWCAPVQAQEAEPYADLAKGWKVEFVPGDPGTRTRPQCRATRLFGVDNALRIVFGDRLFAIDFVGRGSRTRGDRFDVVYWFDLRDQAPSSNGTARKVPDNEGIEWMRIRERTDEPAGEDAVTNGRFFSVTPADASVEWRYSLDGSKEAVQAAIDCVHNRVMAQAAPPPPPPPLPPPVVQIPPPPPPPQRVRQADCLMTVRGRNYIDGRCQYEQEPDGSFRIFGERYFAYVNMTGRGVADASWNGDPPAQHAQQPLGELRRNGACWENLTVRICAWELGQRPPQRPAPPPPPPVAGKTFFSLAPGLGTPQVCVDITGGQMQVGTPIQIWGCHQQFPQRFAYNPATGQIVAASAPQLCVDANDRQQLRLANCATVGRKWRIDSATSTVRSNDGLCWDVEAGLMKQGQPVQAWACHNGINQRFQFR